MPTLLDENDPFFANPDVDKSPSVVNLLGDDDDPFSNDDPSISPVSDDAIAAAAAGLVELAIPVPKLPPFSATNDVMAGLQEGGGGE